MDSTEPLLRLLEISDGNLDYKRVVICMMWCKNLTYF